MTLTHTLQRLTEAVRNGLVRLGLAAALVMGVSAGTVVAQTPAVPFEPSGTAAWVYDHNTATVLLAFNADRPIPPASMSKLMTLNMLFEAIQDGRVTLETTFSVSTRARMMGGSSMFLDERHRPTVEDLIRGIIVHSGNDATVVVAEGLAGTEEAFARLMTTRAQELGMTESHFVNASGWPHPEHRMSMHDLGVLAVRLIEDFPDLYPYFAETSFTWADITQPNRNPILSLGLGADGLKTGHTSEAGYGLVGSAMQGDRRVTFVVTGHQTERARLEESERLLNWAFRQFVERTLFEPGTRVAEAEVWMGDTETVGLVVAEQVRPLLPALGQDDITARVSYNGPISAPISAGQELGELVITIPTMDEIRVPLLAEADVAQGGFMVRMQAAADTVMRRVLGNGAGL